MKKLPIYDIVIKDETQGVGFISLVDEPAIGVDWIKLSAQNQIHFKANKDRQILYGPFLIPNMLIYRHDEKLGEYYVRFSKEEIDKIATKFNEDLNNKNINFMHTDTKVEAFVAQNWVIEGDQDKSKNLGFDLPEGTWFGGVKISDANFWNDKVKSDEVKGFSVEILADLELSLKNKEQKMENQVNLAQAVLNDGTTIYFDGVLAVDTAVFTDEAMATPLIDGEYITNDGNDIKVAGGKVIEISPVQEVPVASADLAVDTTQPAQSQALTAEEVSGMIDARFAELMSEITALKTLVEGNDQNINDFKSQVNEKFASTPAVDSIKKENAVKIDDKFSQVEARIREFAKNK